MPECKLSITQVNQLSREEFVNQFGAIFEHSPWVAEQAFDRRPYRSADDLLNVMSDIVLCAPEARQLSLIRAHPDLVGRAAGDEIKSEIRNSKSETNSKSEISNFKFQISDSKSPIQNPKSKIQNSPLTPDSAREQSSAGLFDLSSDEIQQFKNFNAQYWKRFGFPFIICARENKKDAILAAFPVRLANSPAQEIATALSEISKIAKLRLLDRIQS